MKLFKKIFLASFIVFSIFSIGVFTYLKNTLDEIQNKDIITYKNEDIVTNENNGDNDTVNILIAGVAKYSLADTIILCNFNPNNKSLNFLSIPRDTFYHRPGFDESTLKKINASHAIKGNSSVKSQSLISSVSDMLDVNVDHFIKMDFEGVEKVINVLGGVEIDIEKDMYYFDPKDDPPLLIDFKKGTYKLNGENSLKYLRYRDKITGDLGRVARQQKFIKSLIAQSISIKVFNILDVAKEHIEITMETPKIVSYLTQLYKIDSENINFTTLPGEPKTIDGISYFVYNKLETEEIISSTYK